MGVRTISEKGNRKTGHQWAFLMERNGSLRHTHGGQRPEGTVHRKEAGTAAGPALKVSPELHSMAETNGKKQNM